MNKYKMISICSLTIACVLMLSILLPGITIANDKESIDLSMHYESSQVTANILVNSEVYTGIVCKYLIVDDVLKYEDILTQTRENGMSINLDKSEDNKYTAVVPNVNKRYVVIYVSIGNCSLCDYLDCNPNKISSENNKQEIQTNHLERDMNINEETQNNQKAENQNNQEKETQNNQAIATETEKKQEQQTQDEKKVENNKQEEQKVKENAQSQAIEELVTIGAAEKTNTTVTNRNQTTNINTKGKSSVDTTNFEEIEKVISTSTVDGNMPQTGEDDFIKILGIIVFSVISMVSFYKYKSAK